MPKREPENARSQRQKFIDAARDLGAEHSEAIYKRALAVVAKASGPKAKKAAKKRKR